MSKLDMLTSEPIRDQLSYQGPSSPIVLAINAGAALTVKTTNAIPYTNNGIIKQKAILSAQSIVPTHNPLGVAQAGAYVQPIGVLAYILLCLDAAGAVKVVQGGYDGQKIQQDPAVGIGAMSNFGTSFVGSSDVPDTPDGLTAFGLIKVFTTSATFTPGTDALDKANVAFTFFDLQMNPGGRP